MAEASTGNLIKYLQERFADAYEKAKGEAKTISQEAWWRRTIAYSLKGIAVFGGISIAAGLHGIWSQVIGILITVVVAVDALSSNHRRLLFVTEASNAYRNLLRDIEQTYNIKLGEILKLRERGRDVEAKDKLESFINELLIQLQSEQNRIEKGLQEADLKLLETIKLEHHTV